MQIKPIKSESDYEKALHRVEVLWNSVPRTPDGEELDALVVLIDAYEEAHFPIEKPSIIDAIRFRHDQMKRR